ncbi:MAG: hypothetical protein ABJD07_05420 [Gemmatimonadaceae bacterium]
MRTPVTRYLRWHAADFIVERGLPLLIVNTLFVVQLAVMLRVKAGDGPVDRAAATIVLSSLLGVVGFTGAMIAVNGIVSNDRKHGYFRFLFAKPVSVAAYYALAFVVSAAGMLVCGAAFLGGFARYVAPVVAPGALLFLMMYFVAVGGLGFLLSVVTRYDWIALGAIWVATQLARDAFPAERYAAAKALLLLLPPTHLVQPMSLAVLRGEHVGALDGIWLVGYGVAAFVLGVILVRRRSLAA